MTSCSHSSVFYASSCDKDKVYIKIEIDKLVENINDYDGKYVEIEGIYKSDFEESAIYSSKNINVNNLKSALWVAFDDFVIKCPLISSVSKQDLFGKDKSYRGMFNRTVLMHGRIDVSKQGHLSLYEGSIRDITLVVIKK